MKIWLALITGILIAVNLLAIYYLDPFIDRWFRFLTTAIFLLIFLFKSVKSYQLLAVFALLVICDGLLVFYEMPVVKYFVYIVRILAYLNLILLLMPKLSKLKFNLITIVIACFIVAIDLYVLHVMAETLPGSHQNTLFISLFYLLGILSLALAAASLSYLNRYADGKGFYLVIVSLGFVLSDIFYYNAHYLQFTEFFYLDRLANIIGVAFLLAFAINSKNSKKSAVIN
ncbi:hypothetical protein [Christiangramia sp. SM2212]|uniref:YhhN-like protein n=1 Tax=Christiangramia sediminicola TaxID=3073267 RepID=A0ABU1EMK5_9FLAO|nr:hypothetical protein [Christiangramia sp. SM2212]MDR5589621.1 hypothetical protein [Christiangramia sp. SM2212]